MVRIIDTHGHKHDINCIACSIQNGDLILPVERIYETEHFVVEQDLEYPIEGFLIVVSKRHVLSLDELTEDEIQELAILLRTTRKAMRTNLNISNITLIQEENTATSHFHIWLFPWHSWMHPKWNGKLEQIKDIMKVAKTEMSNEVTLEKVSLAAIRLKEALL